MLNDLKENDLILVIKSFSYTEVGESSIFLNQGIVKTGCVLLVIENKLLVIENNFGAVYKDRYTIFLLNDKRVNINSNVLGWHLGIQRSSEENDYFKILNR
jgi:hypothetical protein